MPRTDNLNNKLKDLIEKYITNSCSKTELEQLLFLIQNEKEMEGLTQTLKDYWEKLGKESALRESELIRDKIIRDKFRKYCQE